MRLVYLWIESYRYIKQRGYLLNANYEVHYDAESKELEIKKAESLDSLLYGDKLSVTAIVGDNGAGKSTLLDAIRLVLFDERSRKKEIEGFLIWEGENQLSIFSFGEEPLKIISSISCEKQ
ncbi:MAG: AAA family ATPase [Lachnospiraceae bacterium]|nr:AAA family ATPase [Lachnospiraceae bacterium]